ncbi:MAG: exodeoxyribonuclease VII small subunit [Syntrophomonadaceae bacterium]|nr:exodeoxyribonuclease VII small subunit [Syntrophomonadaceae bacterium]
MMSFDKDFNRLQEIVKRLEEGDLPLQTSLELFEEGIGLFRRCQEELSKAEGKISQLITSIDQGWEPVPLDLTGGGGEKD